MPPLVQFFVDWAALIVIGSLAVTAFASVAKMISPGH